MPNKCSRVIILLSLGLTGYPMIGQSLPFTIESTSLPSYYPGTASYTITKNTPIGATGNIIKYLPPNVSISSTGTTCATQLNAPFTLNYQESCVLNLTVSGPVSANDLNPKNHLMICLSDRATCAGPAPNDAIHVSERITQTLFALVGDSGPSTARRIPVTYYSKNGGDDWVLSSTLPALQGTSTSLNGISCSDSNQLCSAVGYYSTPSSPLNPVAYTSEDAGVNWTQAAAFSNPASITRPRLNAVTCSSNGRCTAVGSYTLLNTPTIRPLSYISTNHGQSWSLSSSQASPIVVGLDHLLRSVACDITGILCTTVGLSSLASTPFLSYYSHNGGNSWTLSTVPPPVAFVTNGFNSVTCDNTGQHCIAVGSSGQTPLSMISSNGGQNWLRSASQPTPPAGTGSSSLSSVACSSNGNHCTTVGTYKLGTVQEPLAYFSINGGDSWQRSSTLVFTGTRNTLDSVTCDSRCSLCAAVGVNRNSGNPRPQTYISSDCGDHWRLSTTQPDPQGLITTLTSVN